MWNCTGITTSRPTEFCRSAWRLGTFFSNKLSVTGFADQQVAVRARHPEIPEVGRALLQRGGRGAPCWRSPDEHRNDWDLHGTNSRRQPFFAQNDIAFIGSAMRQATPQLKMNWRNRRPEMFCLSRILCEHEQSFCRRTWQISTCLLHWRNSTDTLRSTTLRSVLRIPLLLFGNCTNSWRNISFCNLNPFRCGKPFWRNPHDPLKC